jgi:hypothetical protein
MTVSFKLPSSQAAQILKDLFPEWDPISTDSEPCAVCEALVHASKGDKREIKRRAEDEKVCNTCIRIRMIIS